VKTRGQPEIRAQPALCVGPRAVPPSLQEKKRREPVRRQVYKDQHVTHTHTHTPTENNTPDTDTHTYTTKTTPQTPKRAPPTNT